MNRICFLGRVKVANQKSKNNLVDIKETKLLIVFLSYLAYIAQNERKHSVDFQVYNEQMKQNRFSMMLSVHVSVFILSCYESKSMHVLPEQLVDCDVSIDIFVVLGNYLWNYMFILGVVYHIELILPVMNVQHICIG